MMITIFQIICVLSLALQKELPFTRSIYPSFSLALAITGNAFGAAILTAIFAAIIHLLPFRLATPAMLIGVDTGTIKTIGIKGMQSIGDEGDMMLLGFVGVVINFFLPTGEISPLFIAGYALAALPNPFG